MPEGHRRTVVVGGHTVVLFNSHGRLFAVDNRCPHMGFPLDRGTVQDCILTCHWHHARFDLETGGTFDQWADDVRVFPLRVEDGALLVDVADRGDRRQHFLRRLGDGLERDIRLVIAKSVIALLDHGGDPSEVMRAGLEFRGAQPARRLGRRIDDPNLYGQPRALASRRRPPTRYVSRTRCGRRGQ